MFNKKLIVALLTVAVLFLGVYSFAQGGSNDDDQNEETQNEDDNDEEQVSGENEIPLIKITGSNDMTINVGRTYTDAGATATDEEDGDLTDDIVINNNVNTLVVGNYTVTYDVEDSNKNKAVQAIRTVHVVDRTKPTISLLGETAVEIEVGNAYTDAGAKANDNYNGNITDHIVIVNPVNTNIVGTYTITYNAKDDADNTANEVTRTVNVVDTTAPVITLNGNKTLTIQLGSTYIDQGATALDNYDKDITSKIVVTSTVNPSKVGNYTVTYNVDDNAGNSATAVVRSVKVTDTQAPTVTFGTNGNANYAKSASTTVTVEDNGVIDNASLKYQWTQSATAPTEASFTKTFVNGAVISTPSKATGTYYLWVIATDDKSNTSITSSNVFYIDNIKPVITGVKANTNYNHSVTPIVSEDNLESLKLLIESTSETIDFTSGTEITLEGRYVLTARDKAGNETVVNFYLDYTLPTIKNGDAVLTSGISLKDDVNLVIFDRKLTQVKINDQIFKSDKDKSYFTISNNQYSSDVTFRYTITAEGTYTVIGTDLSGNNTTVTFTIDKTAPEITIGDYTKNPTNKDIEVTATTNEGTLNVSSHIFTENGSFDFIATDAAGNVTTKTVTIGNIDKVAPEITIGDYTKDLINKDIIVTATTNEGTLNAGSHTFTENGSFDFIATDAAGNVTTKTVTIGNIDKTAPVFDLASGYHTTGNITINVTELNLKSINVNNQDLKTNVLVNNGAVLTEEGTYKLTATDLAGNKAEIWVAIDRTAPKIEGVTNGGIYKDSVTVTISDKFLTLVRNGDTTYQYPSSIHIVGPGTENRDKTLTLSDDGTYTVVGTDKVGNSTTVTFTIDKTAPTVSYNPNGSDTPAPGYNVVVNVSDLNGLNNEKIKYLWSTSETAPTSTMWDNYGTIFTSDSSIASPTFDSGAYYLWIMAEDGLGNIGYTVSNAYVIYNPVKINYLVTNTYGYNGYSAEIGLVDGLTFGKASSVEMSLYKGEELLATNKLINGTHKRLELKDSKAITTPFAPFGDFDYVVDGYWSHKWTGSKTIAPDRGVVTVVINGVTYTKEIKVNLNYDEIKLDPIKINYLVTNTYSYNGYSAEIALTHDFTFGDASSVEMSIYKGEELLATNKLINGTHKRLELKDLHAITTPFAPFGDYDYVADGYWSHKWIGSKTTAPDRGVVTVVINGVTYTKEIKVNLNYDEIKLDPIKINYLVTNTYGYNGYSAEIALTHDFTFGDASSVEMSIYKGEELLATNKLINGTHKRLELKDLHAITTPFAPFGDYDYVADGYWSHKWIGSKTTAPDRGVVTVVINGVTYTKEIKVNLNYDEIKLDPVSIDSLVTNMYDYHGYSAEIALTHDFTFGDASSVEMSIYKGEELLATNKLINGTHKRLELKDLSLITTPFAPYGDYDYVADGYWSHKWIGSKTIAPDRGVVTVVINGVTYTKEINVALSLAPVPLKITTTASTFTTNVPKTFTITTTPNDDAGEMVRAYFTLPLGATIEYQEGGVGPWIPLTDVFGPATGFPLGNITTTFRGTFASPGKYNVTLNFKKVLDNSIVGSKNIVVTVND